MKTALELISEERQRQIEKEGYTKEHDDGHDSGELSIAAACYAAFPIELYRESRFMSKVIYDKIIPFGEYEIDDKKHDELKRLVIAGALIVAEIDRLQNI